MAIQRFILTCSGPSALWRSVIRQKLTLKMVAENSFETSINVYLVIDATPETTAPFISTVTRTWDHCNWTCLSKLCDCPNGRWFSQYSIPAPPPPPGRNLWTVYVCILLSHFVSSFIFPFFQRPFFPASITALLKVNTPHLIILIVILLFKSKIYPSPSSQDL